MITIYGATGYTGRLCAEEAVRRGLPVRLAGRRREALEALAAELAGGAWASAEAAGGGPAPTGAGTPRIEVAVADATDADALHRLAADSTVLLSTVGPYLRWGRPVVEAALAAGCHYLDVSGEVPFLEWVHGQHDRAVASGVALCPGFGFDGVPGELLAVLAARRLDGPPAQVRVAYLIRHLRMSGGTARTILGTAATGGAAWRDGRLVDEPPLADRWAAPFPPPLGTRGTVSFPAPEIATIGRSTGARSVRVYMAAPASRPLAAVARPVAALTTALASTPLWGVLERGADLLPDGPDPEARAATKTAILVEAVDATSRACVWARVVDLYAATAKIAVTVAAALGEGASRTGTLTPSQAVDPAALLEAMGARWEDCDAEA